MRVETELFSFIMHFEWYRVDDRFGYIPIGECPLEIQKNMLIYDRYHSYDHLPVAFAGKYDLDAVARYAYSINDSVCNIDEENFKDFLLENIHNS